MKITWDERKRLSNIDKHGFDFSDLTVEFFDGATIFDAKSKRFMAIGRLDGVITVVFAKLGTQGVSVISMRAASKREREAIK